MEEKQKKEVNVKEEKQAMGIIWLVGILVILLVCSIVYSISLRNKLVQEQQAQEQQSEEQQAKVENQNSIEVKESE